MIGVSLQLFNGASPSAGLTGIQALWWDVTEPKDGFRPIGKSSVVTTDASGYISLDLSSVTGLAVGGFGFLMLYQLNGSNHEDSLIFAGKVQTSDIVSGVDMYYYDPGWTRPTDWLTLPDVTDGDQVFYGLMAVFDHGSNFAAIKCRGAYTIDWGDGSPPENIADNVQAQHLYNYSTISAGTYSSRGYRQVIVTVTPQAGQSLTEINCNVKHTSAASAVTSNWLDVNCGQAVGNTAGLYFGTTSNCRMLERCKVVGTGSRTNFSYMFQNCYSLKSIPVLNTASGTNFTYMFQNCSALQSIPALNTAAGTIFTNMFAYAYSLQSIPLLNTAMGTNFSAMFYNCYSLQSIPALNTAAGTNFSNMFLNCNSLQSIPLLNTAMGTNFSAMFQGCFSLQSIPALNCAAGTNLTNMFYSCNANGRSQITGAAISHSYQNNALSAIALDEIYTNLPTVVGQTITVSGNWGVATDNPSIATAKGWTVTG